MVRPTAYRSFVLVLVDSQRPAWPSRQFSSILISSDVMEERLMGRKTPKLRWRMSDENVVVKLKY